MHIIFHATARKIVLNARNSLSNLKQEPWQQLTIIFVHFSQTNWNVEEIFRMFSVLQNDNQGFWRCSMVFPVTNFV